jgi:hypothetical protein
MVCHSRLVATAIATVGAAAVLALSACSGSDDKTSSPSNSPESSAAPSVAAAPVSPTAAAPDRPLPDLAALTDVLNRLADQNLPGAEKVPSVQGATPEQLDKFTKAISDAGFSPLSFTVKDPKWSPDTPGDVDAVVTINSPNPKLGGFAVTMTFSPNGDGWQLSKRTSELLLKAGTSLAGGSHEPASPPPPPATPNP